MFRRSLLFAVGIVSLGAERLARSFERGRDARPARSEAAGVATRVKIKVEAAGEPPIASPSPRPVRKSAPRPRAPRISAPVLVAAKAFVTAEPTTSEMEPIVPANPADNLAAIKATPVASAGPVS